MSPIKPKFTLGVTELSQKAGKKFTDREEFISAFYRALETKISDEHKILMYYGVGGIGKTTLRKELTRIVEEKKPNTVHTVIDLDTPTYREQETALFILRNNLHQKFKIHFPTFDIAYTIYWQKTHPQTPLTKYNFPLLTGVNAVANIMSVVGEMPYIGFIPKLTKAFATGRSVYKEWWRKRGEKELKNLPNLEPKEISERMPMFWASDLRDYLSNNHKNAVIFLDTYEALWENVSAHGGFFMRDEWIRELVTNLPEVIWIICGREKLRWDEQDEDWNKYISQHLLGQLSDKDSRFFLNSCGVNQTDVQNVIIKASKGVPYFLDLAVDTFYEINSKYNREPEVKDFAKTQQDVLNRFLRYLDKTEIQTLNVLSSARKWNVELFRILVSEFKTGYPITNMNELFRFSFINEGSIKGTWVMHDLMRETIQAKQDPEILKMVHKHLFDYYVTKLANIDVKNITEENKSSLIEAFYHGKICSSPKEYIKWFIEISKDFDKAAEYKTIIPLFEDLIALIGEQNNDVQKELADAQIMLARLYEFNSRFDEAKFLLEKAINIRRKIFGDKHHDFGRVLNNLAVLYGKMGKYSESENILKQVLEMNKKEFGDDNIELANPMTNLGILYYYCGKYQEAEPLYKKVLEIREKILGEEHIDVAAALNNLGLIYFAEEKYREAEIIYLKALNIYKKNLGDEHPDVALKLNNLALAYEKQNKLEEAEKIYKNILSVYKKTFGDEHLNIAITENNYAKLFILKKDYLSAKKYLNNALSIFEKILDPDHPFIKETKNSLEEIDNSAH